MRIGQSIRDLFYSRKGEGIITALYTMLLLTVLFFIGIDLFGYAVTAIKLRNTCSEVLTLMKIENGFDGNIREKFLEYAAFQGLETSNISVSGTPKYVQRGEVVSITANMPYVLSSLRPMGHQFIFEIKVEMWGLAQDFIQGGG